MRRGGTALLGEAQSAPGTGRAEPERAAGPAGVQRWGLKGETGRLGQTEEPLSHVRGFVRGPRAEGSTLSLGGDGLHCGEIFGES